MQIRLIPQMSLLFCHLSFARLLSLKAKHHAHNRMHTAEESRNDYAAHLQKYNKEQNYFYYTETPQIYNVRCLHTITCREDAVHVYKDRRASKTVA